ncbi:uncharacterized protein CBL_00861 [Carabus blaptoides fortunei]
MNNSVQYIYKKPGITDECSVSEKISELNLLNLRGPHNADGNLTHQNKQNSGRNSQSNRRSCENYQSSSIHFGNFWDVQKRPADRNQRTRSQITSTPKHRGPQKLKHVQSQRERSEHGYSGNTVFPVRSEVCNSVHRKRVDQKQGTSRPNQSDQRLVNDQRMSFRFSEKKIIGQYEHFLQPPAPPSFPFRQTPSGNLKIVPDQVIYTTNKLSVLVAHPSKTKVNIEETMDKKNIKNFMPPIPSNFFQMPPDIIRRRAEVAAEEGGDGPDGFKPEIKLERLGYLAGDPIDYATLPLPTKTNLYHELYRRISNYVNTDVQVIIGMEEFSCHSMVLQTYSGFFEKRVDVRRIELPHKEVSVNAFVSIYDWMISGKQCVKLLKRDNALEIFVGAQYLEIKELEEQCWAFLLSESVYNEDTAYMLYVEAKKLNVPSVKELMVPRIRKFFLMLVSLQDFLELDVDEVCVLLSSSYIVVSCEMDVLMSAMRWLKHDWEGRNQYTVRLMSCIRFGLIAPWQLVEIKRNRANPEIMEIMNSPEITKLVEEGLSFVVIKYWYAWRSSSNYVDWLDLLTLNEPPERNWTGTEKNYDSFKQFLAFLNAYREEYLLSKNKMPSKCSLEDNPTQTFYPPSEVMSQNDIAGKEFFASVPAAETSPNEEEVYYDTDDRSISVESSKSMTESNAASTVQSVYRGYKAEDVMKKRPVQQTNSGKRNEKKEPVKNQGVYAQNMKVLSMFTAPKNNERRSIPKKTNVTILSPHKNKFLSDGSLFSYDRESVIIFGGLDANSAFGTKGNTAKDIYRYLPEGNTWDYVGELPEPRHYHSTAFFRGRVYLAGGANPLYDDVKEKTTVVNTVWSYDPVTRAWYKEPNLNRPRRNFALIVSNMKLVLSSVERLEDGTWTEVASMKTPRMGMACAKYRDCIWVAGGMCTTKRNPLTGSVECYDAKRNEWTRIENLRFPRCFAAMFAMNDQLYLIGGAARSGERERNTISISAVDVWDPRDRQWKLKTELTIPRHGHSVAYLGTQILVLGGVTTVYMRSLMISWANGVN